MASSANSDLKSHLRTYTGEKLNRCNLCDKVFSIKGNLETHIRTHKGVKAYQCSHCDQSFSKYGNLQTHQKEHSGVKVKPFQCKYCYKTFTQSSALQYHTKTHIHKKPYQCINCDKSFSSKSNLQQHFKTHTGEKPYKCNKCDKYFALKGNLQQHIRAHTGERTYQCSHCDKTFTESGALPDHTNIHTGDKPFQCNKCLSLTYHLQTHLLRIHTYQCCHCSQFIKCYSEKELLKHSITCTGEKSYQNKAQSHKGNLETYKIINTGERPYQCNKCDKSFSSIYNLQMHLLRIHTYQCSHCGKFFSRNNQLKIHLRKLKGEKSNKCSQFINGFSEKELLKHQITRTGEKSYQNKAHSHKGNLETYKRIHTLKKSYNLIDSLQYHNIEEFVTKVSSFENMYISYKTLDECVMCYEKFDPSQFTVILSLPQRTRITCVTCKLLMYTIIDNHWRSSAPLNSCTKYLSACIGGPLLHKLGSNVS